MKVVEKEIILHPFQSKAFNSNKRFIAAISGIQGGKTFVGAVWLANQVFKYPNEDHLIAAPTYKILSSSTLNKLFEVIPVFAGEYRKQESYIQIPNGTGKIFIRSTEDPYGMEGMTLRSAWLDEGGQMKAEAWIVIQGRLAIKQGRCFISTTPYNMGWLYQDFYQKWKLSDPNYDVIQFTSVDNPYFPKEEYERAERDMGSRTFARRYRGLFEKMEGLVYEDFGPHHIIEPENRHFVEIIAGIDWGFNNPAAIAIIGKDRENNLFVIDEFYKTGCTTPEIVERAKLFQVKYNVRVFYADSAEPDRIEESARSGLYIRPADKDKDSVRLGIDILRDLFKRNQLFVYRQCTNTIDEFETYHYEEPIMGKEDREDPVKHKDHLMDAIRYAIYTRRPEKPRIHNHPKPIVRRSSSRIGGY